MKNALYIFLLLTYLSLSSGVVVHYNYCRGRLTRVSVWHDARCPECASRKSCCGKCDCCHKVALLVKVDIDQNTPAAERAVQECAACAVTTLPPSAVHGAATGMPRSVTVARYIPPPDRVRPFIVYHTIII